jgi:uncharacterized membrane protein (DUF485 family)
VIGWCEVVQRLSAVRLGLTIFVLAAYFGFLILGASSPALLAQAVIGAIPLSFVIATGLIVGTIILTGIYVVGANFAEGRR